MQLWPPHGGLQRWQGGTAVETVDSTIPDFGDVLSRDRLESVFARSAPALTILCAPSGYGKSVLAAQLARARPFDYAFWVDLRDASGSEDGILANLAASVACAGAVAAESRVAVHSESAQADSLLLLRERLAPLASRSVCVVLDGVGALGDIEAMMRIAGLVRGWTSNNSRVVVTCRSIDDGPIADPHAVWVIEDAELRFTRSELERLVGLYEPQVASPADVDELLDRSGGQPALACLMIRHPESSVEGPLSRDLLWYTHRSIDALGAQAVQALYIAALVQEGSLADLEACVLPDGPPIDWAALSRSIPLLRLSRPLGGYDVKFRAHAALQEATLAMAPRILGQNSAYKIRQSVLERMTIMGAHGRMLAVLNAACDQSEVIDWCERYGSEILHAAGPSAMARCLARLSPLALSNSSRMLLLNASVLRQQEHVDEASRNAVVAQRLAEHSGEDDVYVEASLLIARLALDVGRLADIPAVLAQLNARSPERLSTSSRCLIEAYTAIADAHSGDSRHALSRVSHVRNLLADMDVSSDAAVFAVNAMASVEGQGLGEWAWAASLLTSVADRPNLSPTQRLLVKANLSSSLLETGQTADTQRLIDSLMPELECGGLDQLRAYVLGTRASLEWALGNAVVGDDSLAEATGVLGAHQDTLGLCGCWCYGSLAARAAGDSETALVRAEHADRLMARAGDPLRLLRAQARTELAASLAALGDLVGARRMATAVREDLEGRGANAHMLRADLVLAELDFREQPLNVAIERLAPYAEYIESGSLNYQLAMNVRATPVVLGLMSLAVGAERIPVRLLKMLTPECAESLRGIIHEHADMSDAQAIIVRLTSVLGLSDFAADVPVVAEGPFCHVRLFGGLQVTTEKGAIADTAWRKRKARSLLVMLVLNRGQDLPREVILERLWPDMEYRSARNNFYVMWSTLKTTLAGGTVHDNARNYVQNAGGLCRVTPAVRSDLDEFDDAIAALRTCVSSEDTSGVLEAARGLMNLYRGELLPGDVYDDWVGDMRERLRHGFCDALLTAARYAEAHDEHEAALEFLRRASSTDPWREDVYQATMRCCMYSGGRSGAIEAFLACRDKLAEDLGIDPSAETMKLYEAVLAMDAECATPYESSQIL